MARPTLILHSNTGREDESRLTGIQELLEKEGHGNADVICDLPEAVSRIPQIADTFRSLVVKGYMNSDTGVSRQGFPLIENMIGMKPGQINSKFGISWSQQTYDGVTFLMALALHREKTNQHPPLTIWSNSGGAPANEAMAIIGQKMKNVRVTVPRRDFSEMGDLSVVNDPEAFQTFMKDILRQTRKILMFQDQGEGQEVAQNIQDAGFSTEVISDFGEAIDAISSHTDIWVGESGQGFLKSQDFLAAMNRLYPGQNHQVPKRMNIGNVLVRALVGHYTRAGLHGDKIVVGTTPNTEFQSDISTSVPLTPAIRHVSETDGRKFVEELMAA